MRVPLVAVKESVLGLITPLAPPQLWPSVKSTPLDAFRFCAKFRFMTRVRGCDQLDGRECPGDGKELPPAGETDIRVCSVCLKSVYRWASPEEARLRETAGQRAALTNWSVGEDLAPKRKAG